MFASGKKISGGGGWVDRGDPSVVDFDKTDFTKDGNWNQLNLSSIIPSTAKSVKLRIYFYPIGFCVMKTRKKGNSNTVNIDGIHNEVSSTYSYHTLEVAVGSDGIIEYNITNAATFNALDVSVGSWHL